MHLNKKNIKNYFEERGINISRVDLINPPCRGLVYETHAVINGVDRCVFIQKPEDVSTAFNTLLAFTTDFQLRSAVGRR